MCTVATLLSEAVGCGGLHRANDLVVAGAAAEVAGQPPADLVLGRARVRLEKRLRRDDEAGRADPALQRGVLEKSRLKRMQRIRCAYALDGEDVAVTCFHREN